MRPHWSELPEEDEDDDYGAGTMVRPYTITRGRTAPERDDLTLITLMTTVEELADPALATRSSGPRGLQPEHRLILEQCRRLLPRPRWPPDSTCRCRSPRSSWAT